MLGASSAGCTHPLDDGRFKLRMSDHVRKPNQPINLSLRACWLVGAIVWFGTIAACAQLFELPTSAREGSRSDSAALTWYLICVAFSYNFICRPVEIRGRRW